MVSVFVAKTNPPSTRKLPAQIGAEANVFTPLTDWLPVSPTKLLFLIAAEFILLLGKLRVPPKLVVTPAYDILVNFVLIFVIDVFTSLVTFDKKIDFG